MKSQLAQMSGTVVATVAPVSQLARYVQSDVKGGDFKLAFLQSLIATAVTEAFKNNGRAIAEASALCTGKAKKHRAYHAGFAAVGECKPVAYKGKYDAKENAAIREEINLAAQAATARFTEAFNAIMAEKAEPKAKKADAPAAGAAGAGDETTGSSAASVATVDADVLDIGEAVDAIAAALVGGMLSAAEVLAIRAALVQFDMANEAAPVALAA